MLDATLARWIIDIRNAVLLPLGVEFIDGIKAMLAFSQDEARARIERARRRERYIAKYGPSTWQDADLLAEVAAVAGEGRRAGREVLFRCPFHNDRHPSLRVNPEKRTWYCDPCCKGGGVITWRKLIKAAA